MTIRTKSFDILLALGLVSAHVFGAPPPSPSKSSSNAPPSQQSAAKKAPKKLAIPIPPLDPETEPHYAAVLEGGQIHLLSQSPGFDADDMQHTAASHEKLLTAFVVLDAIARNPELKTPENWRLLRRALIHSDNDAAEILARNFSSDHTQAGVLSMLQAKVNELGLSAQYRPANASGFPTWFPDHREDTFATPKAITIVAINLAQKHYAALKELYSSVVNADGPTNNLFFPVAVRGDQLDGNVFMFCKTGSDKNQFLSTVTIVVAKEKIYGFFHPHPKEGEPHPSIPATATIIQMVLAKDGITDTGLFGRLNEIAAGKLGRHSVEAFKARTSEGSLQSSANAKPARPKIGRKGAARATRSVKHAHPQPVA